jgi:hypothetical protein
MQSSLQSFLQSIRHNHAAISLIKGALRLLVVLSLMITASALLEWLFYFEMDERKKIFSFLLTFSGSAILFLLLKYYIHYKSWFGNSSNEYIASWVGRHDERVKDRLLNAYQLESQMNESRKKNDLIVAAISNTVSQIESKARYTYNRKIEMRFFRNSLTATAFITILFLIFSGSMFPALNRIAHYKTEFPVPLPFALVSLSGNQDILGGDSITVAFTGVGELPDSVTLNWFNRNRDQSITIGKKSDVYSYQFMNVNSDITFYVDSKSNAWFSHWDVIMSVEDTIFVTDRPVIEDVRFTIVPPEYTGESPQEHPGNITDVTALAGSNIIIDAKSTKPLSIAWILLEDSRKNLTVREKDISGTISLTRDHSIEIFCLDQNDVSNLNPTRYRISMIPDFPPDLLIPSPTNEIELDENMEIHFNIQTSDDYGFSSAWIEYSIIHPEYIQPDTNTYTHGIPELVKDTRSQQVFHSWDISFLNLAPEDEIYFTVSVADNNSLTGPSVTQSSLFIGRYPSLVDMFMALESDEEAAEEEIEDMMLTLEDVRDMVEELELDLLKSEEVNWEHTQKAEEMLNKMEDLVQQVEQMQENMQKINEQIEKNNLTSEPLMEKFSKLQELLDSIMTPELMEAMEKLQQAMTEMDPEQMLEALENLDFNVEDLEEQLNRFIEMFQQALAEQKLDEVIKSLEKMVDEQTEITEEMNNADSEKVMNEMASKERRQEERFKGVQEQMEEASDAMEEFAEDPASEMDELRNSDLTEKTEKSLNDARTSMQENQKSQAQQKSGESQENLEEMLSQAQQIQEDFQQETVAEMMADFQRVMQNTLAISQRQEQLRISSIGLRSNNPRLPETAYLQDKIRRQTNQLFVQLTELSKKTFHISPKIGKALGTARLSMDRSIGRIEQKHMSAALKDQKSAMEGLNEAAKLMLGAMNEMQESGSASGFESFLEQMEQMSQQQQGINQGTMQLGQMGMMAQQQMMQKLQAQQQQLQKSLGELLDEMSDGGPDGLGKASQDMEEVVKDFKRRQVDRRTMERQERILSRMLDSQKSLSQRDYSEKRKSEAAEEIIYTGSSGLPDNMGEREMLLIQAMEDALNEGHSREYQSMMKTYFRKLQKESDALNNSPENQSNE